MMTTYTPLLWLLVLLPLAYFTLTTLVNRKKVMTRSAALFRALTLCCLIIALCRPFFEDQSKDQHIVYLIDVSQSIDLPSIVKAADQINSHNQLLAGGDSYEIFIFGEQIKKTSLSQLRKTIETWDKQFSDDKFRSKSSIVASLNSLKMTFPANKAKKIILFSDGSETENNLSNGLRELKNENIELSFSPLERLQKPEVSVLSLQASSPLAFRGEMVKMTAHLLGNYDTQATVNFVSRGVVVHKKKIQLQKNKELEVSIEVTTNEMTSGIWQAQVSTDQDYFPINNSASCTLLMQGEAKVLAIHEKPSKLGELKKALQKQGLTLEVRGKYGLPESLQELNEFNALILADIEATNFTPRQMDNIQRYVNDFGGGLIMTGSENSFGLGGYYKTPVEEVLPVVSRYEKEKETPSLALILVIDKSGSMGGNPIALAREASKASVELLSARDQVGVVAFDGQAKIVSDLRSASAKSEVLSQIDQIGAGGGTNMYPAMAAGRDMLADASAKIKHMIVLSDGQSQGGDFEGVTQELNGMGVTVSTVSLGEGAAVDLMSAIAQIGNGRAYVTSNAEEMPRIFTKETMEASRSAIKEEPFIPVKIQDADFLQGIAIEEAPLLLGYVMTKVKPTSQIQLITETGDPLMASGRYGLGNSIAFTSDTTELWAGEWQEWSHFGQFWSQTIRSIISDRSSRGFKTVLDKNQNVATLNITRNTEAGNPENFIEWDAVLMNSHGGEIPIEISQTGFGTYTAEFPVPKDSNYAIRLHDKSNNRLKTLSQIKSYPKEYLLKQEESKDLKDLKAFSQDLFIDNQNEIAIYKGSLDFFVYIAIAFLLISTFLRRI